MILVKKKEENTGSKKPAELPNGRRGNIFSENSFSPELENGAENREKLDDLDRSADKGTWPIWEIPAEDNTLTLPPNRQTKFSQEDIKNYQERMQESSEKEMDLFDAITKQAVLEKWTNTELLRALASKGEVLPGNRRIRIRELF